MSCGRDHPYLRADVPSEADGSDNPVAHRIGEFAATGYRRLTENVRRHHEPETCCKLPRGGRVDAANRGLCRESDSANTFVKDSVITTKVKAEMAEEKASSLVKISVVTDNKDMVTLSGAGTATPDPEQPIALVNTRHSRDAASG